MKVLDVEGVAIHNGPESCVVAGNGKCEALTGGDAGPTPCRRDLRHDRPLSGRDAVDSVCDGPRWPRST